MRSSRDLEDLWGDSRQKHDTPAMKKANRKLKKFYDKAEDGRSYTLNEIAEAMGVTRERVRQIEARALKKLYKRLGQVFKDENITPEEAMTVLRLGQPVNEARHKVMEE